MGIFISPTIQVEDFELEFSSSRSSGPGGQNVNKVNSKVTLKWNLLSSKQIPGSVKKRFLDKFSKRISTEGTLSIVSDRYRTQKQNKDDCTLKLKEMLASVATAPKKRKKTKPTQASKRKRLESKKRQSEKKSARAKLKL